MVAEAQPQQGLPLPGGREPKPAVRLFQLARQDGGFGHQSMDRCHLAQDLGEDLDAPESGLRVLSRGPAAEGSGKVERARIAGRDGSQEERIGGVTWNCVSFSTSWTSWAN